MTEQTAIDSVGSLWHGGKVLLESWKPETGIYI
uniref:Uncharacterized protein n=1 Tax=Arundo donax TaxID=35708 RepID=A0A0A8YX89_ARUDO